MNVIYDSILDTVGRTPIVRIRRLAPPGVELYAKVEAFNPLGSIKDRLALGIIEDAERSGRLHPGQTVVEATSGNTGIGLAMVCAARGYPLVVVMAENFSVERRRILRFLGARVVLTPAPLRGEGMLSKAAELAETHGWFLCRQFENEANAEVHSRTTAREIVEAFEGRRLDYWVTGFGTGGTLKGVARVLKAERPETEIVVCEPANSRLLASGVAQPCRDDGSPAGSHPAFTTHPIQGWAPDFIPRLTAEAVALELIDRLVPVEARRAMQMSRELARREGIFTGISGGATFASALDVAASAPEGSTVLCMLPDTGERYLSTPLFDDVPVEMTAEELAISRSTPAARFEAPATIGPAEAAVETPSAGAACAVRPNAPEAEATPEAAAFVDEAIAGARGEVVMFALEWCEFCWAVRRLLRAYGVPFRSIDLDAAEFRDDGRGETVRAALAGRTGSPSLPQLFVGDELVGGCTEVVAAATDGRLQALLVERGIEFDRSVSTPPASFFPAWLQPR